MQGRRLGKPEVYSLEYIEDFFRVENDADGRGSFAAENGHVGQAPNTNDKDRTRWVAGWAESAVQTEMVSDIF